MEINWRKLDANIRKWQIAAFILTLLSFILGPIVFICGALFPVFCLLTLIISIYRIVRKEPNSTLETVLLFILFFVLFCYWAVYSPFARALLGNPIGPKIH